MIGNIKSYATLIKAKSGLDERKAQKFALKVLKESTYDPV